MSRDEAIPERVVIDERSKRDTLEFCGDQQEGLRCMLMKGHGGMHECIANAGRARWVSSRAK